MSAKRARKPLAEASANRRKKPKESSATAPAETFTPISHRKPDHTGEPRIPEGTTLSPLSIFSLYWGDEILEEIVTATNLYAKSKQNGIPPELRDLQREWRPLTVSELKRFLGATIFMGVTKAPQRADYWSRAFVNMPKGSLPLRRYEQIKRYLHISMPPPPNAGKPKWTDKLEPLSSHLRRRSRELYLPSTHVATDEMMVRFKGRSAHTVRMPSKPISCGYKILAICDAGYTIDWLYTSRIYSIDGLDKVAELTPTGSAIFQLCCSLEAPADHRYIVYMDNAFTTIPLLRLLRSNSIGTCGTTRLNSADLPIEMKSDLKQVWNTLDGCVVKPTESGCSDDVLCIRWEDSNIVRFLTTVHPWNEVTLKLRRKPRTTSTNATAIRRIFGESERKALFVPTIVDDYNNHMNGVDLADQRRAAYTTHQRTQRNWLCLFFLLDISVVNAHILMQFGRDEAFIDAIDTGCNPATAPFRQACSAASFRRLLAKELMGTKVASKLRVRRTYVKKTDRFVFHARTKDLEWARGAVDAARSNADRRHTLVAMVKKRRCIVCRFEFKKTKCGRQAPKLAKYECTGCQPAAALCAPEGGECWDKWHSRGAEGSA